METAASAWLDSIERHLDALERRFGCTGYHTLYLGGGTPSWLPGSVLRKTLALLGDRARMGGTGPVEWSIEANPEDVDDDFMRMAADAGVDRLSVGVQSLEDEARRAANRRGDARETMARLEQLAKTWKARWSADLMFGLPGQSARGMARDAAWLAELGAGHVSLYELTLEPGTPLAAAAERGAVRLPDDDERADLYDAAAEALAGAGFRRYEVSNWALPVNECIHNEVYWDMGDWLAVGPSGVGNRNLEDGAFLRLENSADDEVYAADPAASVRESVVGGRDAMFECLMTALRTARGFSTARFARRFGADPFVIFGRLYELFPDLLHYDGTMLTATERGLDTLNAPLVAALSHSDSHQTGLDTGASRR